MPDLFREMPIRLKQNTASTPRIGGLPRDCFLDFLIADSFKICSYYYELFVSLRITEIIN